MNAQHPWELWFFSFVNLCERFGFYILIGSLVLFLQVKFSYSKSDLGMIYGIFLLVIYTTPLIGGLIADRTGKYRQTCLAGLILLFAGYLLLSFSATSKLVIFLSLLLLALGFGLYRGNLIVLLANAYSSDKFRPSKEAGFLIFYVAINIASLYSAHSIVALRDSKLSETETIYDESRINTLLEETFHEETSPPSSDMHPALEGRDKQNYLELIAGGYHFAYTGAAMALLLSVLLFWCFAPGRRMPSKFKAREVIVNPTDMPTKEMRQRMISIGIILFVVTFFWVAYNQSGYSLTLFAKDHTVTQVENITYLNFDLWSNHGLALFFLGIYLLIKPQSRIRLLGGLGLIAIGLSILFWRLSVLPAADNRLSPELFRIFNPFFIIILTPFMSLLFKHLRTKKQEPTTPDKIGFGMLITAFAFILMTIASSNLTIDVNVYWLISTYFLIAVSELLLSPLGMAFLDDLSPARYRGLVQGAWLTAGAVGGFLAGYVGYFYDNWDLNHFFLLLCVLSIIPGLTMFGLKRRLMRYMQNMKN